MNCEAGEACRGTCFAGQKSEYHCVGQCVSKSEFLLFQTAQFFNSEFYCFKSPKFLTDELRFLAEYYRMGQKSVPIRWVLLYHRRVLYVRVVALQMSYCTYLFEDSVTKI